MIVPKIRIMNVKFDETEIIPEKYLLKFGPFNSKNKNFFDFVKLNTEVEFQIDQIDVLETSHYHFS